MTLNEVGFENVALHAMVKQRQRLEALHKFKADQVKILIATDVAARGLDIPHVQLVLNHNIPNVPKEYIHRVGRTARAGRGGVAISLITPHDIKLLKAIEELIGTELIEYKVDGNYYPVFFYFPSFLINLILFTTYFSDKEIVTIFTQISVTKREAEIKLDETDYYEKKFINKKKKLILQGMEPDEAEEFLRRKFKSNRQKKRKNETDEDLKDNDTSSETKSEENEFESKKIKNIKQTIARNKADEQR